MVGGSYRTIVALLIAIVALVGTGLQIGATHIGAGAGPTGRAPIPPPSAHPAVLRPATSPSSVLPSESGVSKAVQIKDALQARGLSVQHVNFPDFGAATSDRDREISPTQTQAPAPMGVADLGLENRSGTLEPYALNTTSAEGTVDITNLQSLYVDGDGANTYGIQMNSVAAGVTIFGNSSYEFWSQNYVDYTPSTQQLVFGDEVWNFSSPSGLFPVNGIYAYGENGTLAYMPFLYQGFGPAITIGYPFTLSLYLNTSTIADRPAFFFNYTVSNASFRQSASFDYLVFNSTVGNPTQAAPIPYYQADGYGYDSLGLINDMEIDLLGNDGGDLTTFFDANVTLSLQYYDSATRAMEDVPSAYDAGQETGEASDGLSIFSTGGPHPVAEVRSGPSFVRGLWNYSAVAGAVPVTVHLNPANAFLFVTPGQNESAIKAQWVPTLPSGTTTFFLTTGGTYNLTFLFSEYAPFSTVLTASTASSVTIHMVPSSSEGIYTPLLALDNAELANISASGSGTLLSPYVIYSNQYRSLDPVFAAWDDFLFPVFPGLLLAHTSAHVTVVPAPFEIDIPSWQDPTSYGLPATNNLQLQLYDTSNVSIVRGAGISGWLDANLAGFPEAAVILWDSTDDLVASNTFDDQGTSMVLYGGENNTIWGNSFYDTPTTASNPAAVLDSGAWVTGINESESDDLVFNNYVDVPVPAFTPNYDPFLCNQYDQCGLVNYTDAWNVARQPAANQISVNGFVLTGSIVGTSYQGGNWWSNYGTQSDPYGILPYNDSGRITVGGDYVPLEPFTLYTVTFEEAGLAPSSSWNVTEEGVVTWTTKTQLDVESPNGTFLLSVGAPTGYVVSAPSFFTVSGSSITVELTFLPLVSVSFSASGLASGTPWSVTLNGTGTGDVPLTKSASVNEVVFTVPIGPYAFWVQATGFTAQPSSGSVTVPITGASQAITFAPIPGTLLVKVVPETASLWVDGAKVNLSNGAFQKNVTPGVHSVEATLAGYADYFNNVSVAANRTSTLDITMEELSNGTSSKIPPSQNSTSPALSPLATGLVLGLGILSAILIVGVLYFALRRGPPSPPETAPAPESKPEQSKPPAETPPAKADEAEPPTKGE